MEKKLTRRESRETAFLTAFAAAGFPMDVVARRMNRWHIDLPVANFIQLEAAGVPIDRIQVSSHCTYAECDRFFSARRLGVKSGRLYSGIMSLREKQETCG